MATITGGVLFDFDGVIVNSLPAHFAAWRLAVIDLFNSDPGDIEACYKGQATPAFGALLAKKHGDPNKSIELAARKVEILANRQIPIPLMPNVKEALVFLRENGIPYGIASNAPRKFVHDVAESHDLDVQVMLGREDSPRGKPHPDLYLLAAKKIGLTMHQHRSSIVFEDSKHGLKAAIRAGMIPIGVNSQHTDAELVAAGALSTCCDVGVLTNPTWISETIQLTSMA